MFVMILHEMWHSYHLTHRLLYDSCICFHSHISLYMWCESFKCCSRKNAISSVMCKQIPHDVPHGASLAITYLAFIGSSSCTGYWAPGYKSLPGCLKVINSKLRVIFGFSWDKEIKNKCREPLERSHFTCHNISSCILALRNRQRRG